MTDGVFAMGNNALSSFAAHSFLVTRPEGNLMVDSPRFNPALAEGVDSLGGVAHVLLSHRDDVADAERLGQPLRRPGLDRRGRCGRRALCHRCDR